MVDPTRKRAEMKDVAADAQQLGDVGQRSPDIKYMFDGATIHDQPVTANPGIGNGLVEVVEQGRLLEVREVKSVELVDTQHPEEDAGVNKPHSFTACLAEETAGGGIPLPKRDRGMGDPFGMKEFY